jgi:hypothetical protein
MTALETLLGAEHVCAPPDSNDDWLIIAQHCRDRYTHVYICNECGQHFARVKRSWKDAARSRTAAGRSGRSTC